MVFSNLKVTSKQVPWEDDEDYILHLGKSWESQFSWNHPATMKISGSGSTLGRSWCRGLLCGCLLPRIPSQDTTGLWRCTGWGATGHTPGRFRRFSCASDCGHTRPRLRILKHRVMMSCNKKSSGRGDSRIDDSAALWFHRRLKSFSPFVYHLRHSPDPHMGARPP